LITIKTFIGRNNKKLLLVFLDFHESKYKDNDNLKKQEFDRNGLGVKIDRYYIFKKSNLDLCYSVYIIIITNCILNHFVTNQ